jgi:HlyD family secretion protein
MNPTVRKFIPALALVAAVALGYYAWSALRNHGPNEGLASGNGRIEATEIDVATKLAGRVEDILVREGDFVRPGRRWRACRSTACRPSDDEA